MGPSRLTLALESGAVALPATGRVVVYRPRAEHDLSALATDRLHLVQGFQPDHAAWAARGYRVDVAAAGSYAAAIVFVPRAKSEARALIAEAVAAAPGGPVVVDGQKTDGVDSLLRACRARAEVGTPLAKAHGKTFGLHGDPEAFADWRRAAPDPSPEGFRTVAGIFSADGVDAGSARLAAALPRRLPGRIADLGAGWGYLGRAILAREGVAELHLVEAEHAALACARENVADPRARFHWADATRFAPEAPFDAVVSNPPFHDGRAADPALGTAFIEAAAGMLTAGGTLWLVANRHLPYERPLAAAFREMEEVAGDARFKVLRGARPARRARRRR